MGESARIGAQSSGAGKEKMMKSNLSALKFVRNNKRQAGVMIIALSLTFMTMYLINFLFLTTKESFQALFLEQPKKMALISLSLDTMREAGSLRGPDEDFDEWISRTRQDIIERIKKHDGISNVYLTQCLSANYQGIVGQVGYDFPLLESGEIPAYLEHMDAGLIQGRLPENSGEILVDKKVLSNMKMEVGGYFNESVFGQNFKVVGVLDSPNLTCVGTPQGYVNSGWYTVILCDAENSDMTKVLNDVGIVPTEYDTIYDAKDWADMYNEMVVDQLDTALLAILIVVMIFLTISVMVAYVSFMRSRENEYCLYTSIGFGRKDVYGMMMREIGIIFGSSILAGAVIAVITMLLVGRCVLDSLGLVYQYFYPAQLLRILAAFMAIVGFLQIPIIVTINHIKTIDFIEE